MTTVRKNRPMWLYRGWLLVSVIALTLVAMEVLEHQPIHLNNLELEFVAEVLLLGLGFPLAAGVTLGWLNRANTQQGLRAKAGTGSRVLIIKNELVGLGIKHLLSQEPGLHIIGVTPDNPSALLHEIQHFKPDVVVIDRNTDVAKATGLSTFLRDCPHVRLIMASIEDEWIQVHDIQQVLITKTDELTTLIRGR